MATHRDLDRAQELHYALVGRVVVAAAQLEEILAMLVMTSLGEDALDRKWWLLPGSSGLVMRLLRRASRERPDDPDLDGIIEDASSCFAERGRLVHSTVWLSHDPTSPGGISVTLRSPRDGSQRPLPARTEVADLLLRMSQLQRRTKAAAARQRRENSQARRE